MKLGQTLVEIMIALGIATLVLVSIAQVATKSVSNSGVAQRQSQATIYGVEGMEWVRSQRGVLGWDALYALGSSLGRQYCLNSLSWVSGVCGAGTTISGTEYVRSATLRTAMATPVPAGTAVQRLTIEMTVSWNEKGVTKSSKQTTILTRY